MIQGQIAYRDLADRLEAELRRLDTWQDERPPQEVIDRGGAFGLESMAFTQWLQFVLLPRLRAVADGAAEAPRESHVAAQAVREFDGWHEAADLEAILRDVDATVRSGR